MYPSYLDALKNGGLDKALNSTYKMLGSCSICPRRCRVNRLKNEKGFCQTGLKAKVCSYMPHHGEEPPISGTRGSGTIFFSHCNMSCAYCQNYEFSQGGEGREVSEKQLADFMLQLQTAGCHNINLVTPTHVMPQILQAIKIAANNGLDIPLVYNTSGYELAQVIALLNGIIDIYLADLRYADSFMSEKYSSAPDYPRQSQQALKQMHQQVGIAKLDSRGIIIKGVIIRHLVLPNNLSGTETLMKFIAEELSKETYISLMSQYMPCYKAHKFSEISRRITLKEYEGAQESMRAHGLYNGWTQEDTGLARFAGTYIKRNIP